MYMLAKINTKKQIKIRSQHYKIEDLREGNFKWTFQLAFCTEQNTYKIENK